MASSHWQNQTHGLQSENRNPVTSYSHLTCFSRMMPPAPSLTLSPEQKEELWGGGTQWGECLSWPPECLPPKERGGLLSRVRLELQGSADAALMS